VRLEQEVRRRHNVGRQMVSRRDLAVVFVAVCCAALIIEHGHHVFTDVPPRPGPSAIAQCPASDTMPYPTSCLAFLEGKTAVGRPRPALAPRPSVAPSAAAPRREPASLDRACPHNDNTPYGEACLAFLSGRHWQPDASVTLRGAPRPR
jgi:hypothetical protein